MKQYETGFLISPKLSDEEWEKLVEQMADIVSKKKGKMIKVDKWRKRRLAYPIRKFEEAFYVFFLYEGSPEVSAELERRFKQTDDILRYLTVNKDERENVRRKKIGQRREEKPRVEPEKSREEIIDEQKMSPSEELAAEEEKKEELEEQPEAKGEETPEVKTEENKEKEEIKIEEKKEVKKEEKTEEKKEAIAEEKSEVKAEIKTEVMEEENKAEKKQEKKKKKEE